MYHMDAMEVPQTTSPTYMHDHLLSRLSGHDTCNTPREIIHAPKGVDWKHEREHGNGENMEQRYEHKSLKKVTILSEVQQVLHVQHVHAILRIIRDHVVRNQQRLVHVGSTETEKHETRQTSNRTKE